MMITKPTVKNGIASFALSGDSCNNFCALQAIRVYPICTLRMAALLLVLFASNASQLALAASHIANPRIVGGSKLGISSAPATVALLGRSRVELDGDLRQAQGCGGTVIDTRWVLTAAHCLFDEGGKLQANDVMVLMGSDDLANPVTQPVGVTQIITHEHFTDVSTGNDIALLKLESNSLMTPIELDSVPVTQDEIALIAGWGAITTSSSQAYSSQLQGAFVKMTPGANCSAFSFTNESFICATPTKGFGGSCDGDSGGPLYRISGDRLPVTTLVGITSFRSVSDSCTGTPNPAGYTSVAYHADWIQSKTGIVAQQATEQDLARTNGIEITGAGWWQIQRSSDYEEFYQGQASFVPLPDGTYNVINLSTGEKTENVSVISSISGDITKHDDSVNTRGINLVGEGWWQVQSSSDYTEFYQGPSKFVQLPAGVYIVTNFTTGYRERNVVVE